MSRFSLFGAVFPTILFVSILPVWVSTQSTEDPYDIGTTTIAEIIPTATLTLAAGTDTASTPPPDASVSPLAGHSYFFIDYDCYGQTNLPGWQNKGQYVEQAILDATEIADKSGLWPQYGTDTSDLYFGQDFDQSAYQQNTSLNLLAAANWGDGTYFGYFRPYIKASCDDPFNACGGKIGSDPRQIVAYANNTQTAWPHYGWFGISLCEPFFTMNTLAEVYSYYANHPNEEMQMIYMETSGSKFLHELMHMVAISQNRGKIVDAVFDGSRGRRIYGPQDVAKGARIATQEHDFSKIAFNADSYAIFAQAFYWRNIFGSTPQPTANASVPIPTGLTALDVVADAEDNYVDYDIAPDTKPGPIVPSSAPPAATASSTPTLGVKPTG